MAIGSLRGKRVFVTGAGGFIGSHLVERLVHDGAEVTAMIHYNSRNDWGLLSTLPRDLLRAVIVVAGDIRDPFFVRRSLRDAHIVFHLASLIAIPYSYVAPESYFATNITGALNVMQASLDEGTERIIHTSTSEVYGTARQVPISEDHPLQGQSPYSASKIGADMVAESFYRSFDLPVAIMRPFNTYGPRQSARAIIPTIATQALTGGVVKLGSLAPRRDFTFVEDTVDAFVRMATADNVVGAVTNVGSGSDISVADLAALVLRIIGRDARIEVDQVRLRPQRSEVDRLLCDRTRAFEALGWEPKITLEDGVQRTIGWLMEHMDRYRTDLYNV